MSIRQRVMVATASSAVVVGVSAGAWVAQAPEHAATDVEVVDTAGILYEPDLRAGIAEVRFHEPTTVAVFTHDGGQEALYDDYALNDAVLEHARTSQPGWLSENQQTWADDLYVVAVDPVGRLVGTYFGENRTVSEDQQLAIQDATRDDFRRGQWTDGVVAGVSAGADSMNRPFVRSPGGAVLAGGASLLTVLGSVAYVVVGRHRVTLSRRARAAGDVSMANVVRDYDETELHAHVIPAGSSYGGAMLERFAEFQAGFRELVELGDRAREVDEKDYDSRDALRVLTAYRDKATALDQLDDVIADTAALLNRDHAWPDAWSRQVEPLRDDLEQVDDLIGTTLTAAMRDLPAVQELRSFAARAAVDLDRLRGGLESRETTPDEALDSLRALGDELSARLDAVAGAAARAYSAEADEQSTMEDALRAERSRPAGRGTILGTVDPAWTWFTIGAFQSGYANGTSRVEQSRASSSSSGSTSGFSSSGGSFSGSGSSSRF